MPVIITKFQCCHYQYNAIAKREMTVEAFSYLEILRNPNRQDGLKILVCS